MSTILSVQGLSVQFGALKAVNDVSFEARQGDITAVIGPNGAGKSSLFNLISGAIRPTSGTVRFDGSDVTGRAPHCSGRAERAPCHPADDTALPDRTGAGDLRGRFQGPIRTGCPAGTNQCVKQQIVVA